MRDIVIIIMSGYSDDEGGGLMDFVMQKDISKSHPAHPGAPKPVHRQGGLSRGVHQKLGKTLGKPGVFIGKTLSIFKNPQKVAAMKSLNNINRTKIGFDKVRSSIIKQTKKHKLDKRLRHKLKRRFAREGGERKGASLTIGPNGTIIGRPKKPPIIGSEKTDGNPIVI
jgi:hypothetical protein